MAKLLIPLPSRDFDPTEAAVAWQILTTAGHRVEFATPDGRMAVADPHMLTGAGLGPWASILRADRFGQAAHAAMIEDALFRQPHRYEDLATREFAGLYLPGGHAPGMRPYLESRALQGVVAKMMSESRPVAAVCHGVLLVARSQREDGLSVLHGRRTTALTASMELSAWWLTRWWLGDYYRTYPQTVQQEVSSLLANPADFLVGPVSLRRDRPDRLDLGFVVRDGNYLSGRWPGDVHRLASEFGALF
jgi:protease I